jgi:hypothetical protein
LTKGSEVQLADSVNALKSWYRSRTIVEWRVGVVLNRSVQRLAGSDRSRLLNNRVLKLGLLEDWLIGCLAGPG